MYMPGLLCFIKCLIRELIIIVLIISTLKKYQPSIVLIPRAINYYVYIFISIINYRSSTTCRIAQYIHNILID
jgi:hypothetical protein